MSKGECTHITITITFPDDFLYCVLTTKTPQKTQLKHTELYVIIWNMIKFSPLNRILLLVVFKRINLLNWKKANLVLFM